MFLRHFCGDVFDPDPVSNLLYFKNDWDRSGLLIRLSYYCRQLSAESIETLDVLANKTKPWSLMEMLSHSKGGGGGEGGH